MIEGIQQGPDEDNIPGRGTREINEERLAEAFGEPLPGQLSNYDEVKGEPWLCKPIKIDPYPKWVPLQEMRTKQEQHTNTQQEHQAVQDEKLQKLKV